jgi:4-hydroxy-2-oxoheptanedioate aldolase
LAAAAFSIRERLNSDEPFLFPWLGMPGAAQAGQIARLSFDAVALDLQHGMIDHGAAVDMIQAIVAAGKPAITRVLWNDPGLVGYSLDMGASAVIAPMVNSKAEAEKLVSYAKYPPLGSRSWGGYQMVQAAGVTAGEYLQQANSQTLVFAMVETKAALDAVDDIASVKGLDGLFVGPSDLSIALSNGKGIDKTSPATIEAMKKVVAACQRNKLVAGAFAGTPEIVNTYVAEGFKFLAATTDGDLLRRGASATMAGVKR